MLPNYIYASTNAWWGGDIFPNGQGMTQLQGINLQILNWLETPFSGRHLRNQGKIKRSNESKSYLHQEFLLWLCRNQQDYCPGGWGFNPWPRSMGQGSGVAVSCGVGCRLGSDLAWLWLWCRPAAIAPIRPMASEPPCATSIALKKEKTKGYSI